MSKKDRAARSGEAAEAPQQLTFIVSFAYEVDGAYEIQATSAEEAERTFEALWHDSPDDVKCDADLSVEPSTLVVHSAEPSD